jgi:hypothetical protein
MMTTSLLRLLKVSEEMETYSAVADCTVNGLYENHQRCYMDHRSLSEMISVS